MKKVMIALAALSLAGAAQAEVYVDSCLAIYADKDTNPSAENGQAWYSFYGMKLSDAETMSGVSGYEAITKWLGNNFAVNSASVQNSEAASTASVTSYQPGQPGSASAYYCFGNDGTSSFGWVATDIIAFCFFDNGTDKAYKVVGDCQNSLYFSDEYLGSNVYLNSPYSSGWIAVADVPEPTSGLLMLLGMAGLALRRKRA